MPEFTAIRSAIPASIRQKARGLRARLPRSPQPAILMYHRVADELFDPWQLAVPPKLFAEQLEWLARNRTALPLVDFAELHRRGELPADAVALTFDDGYACTAELAAPLLERYRLPATVFIAAQSIREGRPFWWDELQQIVMSHAGTTLELGTLMIDVGERQEADGRWPGEEEKRTPRQNAFYELWRRLRTLPSDKLNATMAELRAQNPARPNSSPRLMSPAQARSIRSDLLEFGSHALTHSSLPSLPAEERAREIIESARACAALIGVEPLSFAYPYGDHDEQSRALVREAGFACACSVETRTVSVHDSQFALPRVQVGHWTGGEFHRVLNALAMD